MFQNYEILFAIGTLGTILSLILMLISVIKNVKVFKILSIILIPIFIITFSIGIASGYYYYENSKDILEQAKEINSDSKVISDKNEKSKITSGQSSDPIVITEKTFSFDDTYYYSEFEIVNNTHIEISKLSFHLIFTYNSKLGDINKDQHIFLLDSVIPPNKTVIKSYIWKRDNVEQQLSINNAKLVTIHNLVSYVNINGEEKSMKLDDLKSMLNNNK